MFTNNLTRCCSFLLLIFTGFAPSLIAQSIQVVANPNNNVGGVLFQGGNYPVIFNNKLMIEYGFAPFYSQLAEYNGDSIKLIANPDFASPPVISSPIIYNSNFYNIRYSANDNYRLAKYDGSSYTMVAPLPNDDHADGPESIFNAAVYNDKLYVPYYHNNNSIMTIYNNSSLSIDAAAGDVSSSLLRLNNKLVFLSGNQVATYDGTTRQVFANPTPNGLFLVSAVPQVNAPLVFKNKVYFHYIRNIFNPNVGALVSFDGTAVNVKIDSLPGGSLFYPFITSNMLYFQLQSDDGQHLYLSAFNDSALSVTTNPDAGGQYVVGDGKNFQVLYNGSLFIIYKSASGIQNLVRYNGNQLTVIPNPDGGKGFTGSLYVYDNKIYSSYLNKDSVSKIVSYDGSTFKFISSPPFYQGFNSPVEYNNQLYFIMGNGIQTNLVYLDNGAVVSSIKSGNWSDPATWSSNKIPDATTTVSLNFDIVVDINATCKALTANNNKVVINAGLNLKVGE